MEGQVTIDKLSDVNIHDCATGSFFSNGYGGGLYASSSVTFNEMNDVKITSCSGENNARALLRRSDPRTGTRFNASYFAVVIHAHAYPVDTHSGYSGGGIYAEHDVLFSIMRRVNIHDCSGTHEATLNMALSGQTDHHSKVFKELSYKFLT